jgi:GTP-binding protein
VGKTAVALRFMAKYQFKTAKFIKTAIFPKDFPVLRDQSGKELPEIAVAGRSNVGKSSLLNHLFHTKGLVKTSATPGKTQAINFFVADDSLSFVDLPGYGFAKVPLEVRKAWGPMIQDYMINRKTLKMILFLFDIRRVPNEEDYQLINWAAHHELALLLILTKTDKVNHKEKRDYTTRILEAFPVGNLHYIHYSVLKNQGRSELMAILNDALQGES